jgi:hypothetical protein
LVAGDFTIGLVDREWRMLNAKCRRRERGTVGFLRKTVDELIQSPPWRIMMLGVANRFMSSCVFRLQTVPVLQPEENTS